MSNKTNFIKAALDKVLTYQTPPAVVKYMEMQSALGIRRGKKEGEVNNILYICNVLLNGVAGIQKEIGTNHCSNPLPTNCYSLAFFI
jgi:hypothetical protein